MTDPLKQAQHENRDLEELQALAERSRPTKFGLPTTWRNADEPVVVRGPRDATVVAPTGEEIRSYADDAPIATCGSCRYFDLETGRKKMIEEDFLKTLVHDHRWKPHHLAAPPDSLGLCGASGGTMVVSVISRCCDQFRPRGERSGRWRM